MKHTVDIPDMILFEGMNKVIKVLPAAFRNKFYNVISLMNFATEKYSPSEIKLDFALNEQMANTLQKLGIIVEVTKYSEPKDSLIESEMRTDLGFMGATAQVYQSFPKVIRKKISLEGFRTSILHGPALKELAEDINEDRHNLFNSFVKYAETYFNQRNAFPKEDLDTLMTNMNILSPGRRDQVSGLIQSAFEDYQLARSRNTLDNVSNTLRRVHGAVDLASIDWRKDLAARLYL